MAATPVSKPPKALKKKNVSISPKKPTVISPRRHQSSSRFEHGEEDIAWSLDLDDSEEENEKSDAFERPKTKSKPRRRRRSSARFLRLSDVGTPGAEDGIDGDSPEGGEDFTSSEHLGEIYRQAIRMNAENKINAGNSWGLKLIENMDKFIEEVGPRSDTGSSSKTFPSSPLQSYRYLSHLHHRKDPARPPPAEAMTPKRPANSNPKTRGAA
jgi:condensin complex subunit 2